MGTVLIIVVIAVALFFFMRGMFNFKHGIELTIKPFNEWMMIARSESNKQLEVMSHTLLLEASSLLERSNFLTKQEFVKIFTDSRIYSSDFLLLIFSTVEMQEKLSLTDQNNYPLKTSQPAKIYLYSCISRIYFEGFPYKNNFYKGKEALEFIANHIVDKKQESWK